MGKEWLVEHKTIPSGRTGELHTNEARRCGAVREKVKKKRGASFRKVEKLKGSHYKDRVGVSGGSGLWGKSHKTDQIGKMERGQNPRCEKIKTQRRTTTNGLIRGESFR